MSDGFVEIADGVFRHETALINCDRFVAGKGTRIDRHAVIEATEVRLGRDCYVGEHAVIGGGSAYAPESFLRTGHFFFMTMFSHVNTGSGVSCGDEVGLGMMSRIFTHGAFLSEWQGFPTRFEGVTVGSRVTFMHATVLPGVTVGDDVFFAAMTLVNKDAPSGCLIGGVPMRVLRERCFPRVLSTDERAAVLAGLQREIQELTEATIRTDAEAGELHVDDTVFALDQKSIYGAASHAALVAKNQLRRHGIRFKYEVRDGEFVPWSERV